MNSSAITVRRVRPLLGTFVEIRLQGLTDISFLQSCVMEGFKMIAEIGTLMSFHQPTSDLSRLNRSPAFGWIRVHAHTVAVLKSSNKLFQSSRGVFDIRCGSALMSAGVLPFRSIPAGCPRPDEGLPVEIRGAQVRKTGPWVLDLGGIAKGYAVDCAVRILRHLTRGKSISGTVNAGGDLRTWGASVQVGTRLPRVGTACTAGFKVQDTALATSSLGKGVHIRMPRGESLPGRATASVFAKDCLSADALTKVALIAPPALATACFRAHKARALVFKPSGVLERVIAP